MKIAYGSPTQRSSPSEPNQRAVKRPKYFEPAAGCGRLLAACCLCALTAFLLTLKAEGQTIYGRAAFANSAHQIRIWDSVAQVFSTVPLPAGLNAGTPRFSVDGQSIVFAGWLSPNQAQIYVVRPDGSNLRRVTDGTGNCVDPDFSPDGTRIAYQQVYGDLFIINTDGTGLIDTGFYLGYPKWSRSGTKIIGENWPAGGTYESDLFIYNLQTKQNQQITFHQPKESFHMGDWSADDTKIVCLHSQNVGSTSWSVCVMDAGGSNPLDVLSDWTSDQESPNWSPDDRFISFLSNHSGHFNVWAMWPDGTGRTNLTQDVEDEFGDPNFVFSPPPAGGIVLYCHTTADSALGLFDTLNQTNCLITFTNGFLASDPAFSRDGQWIVFDGRNAPQNTQIYAVRSDGTGLRRITDGTGDCVAPDLSPDGTKVAYQLVYGNLFIMNFSGTGVIDTGVYLGYPRWSPAGTTILGENWPANQYQSDLFLYYVQSNKLQQLTFHKPGESFHLGAWSPDGTKIVCLHSTHVETGNWRLCVMNADGSNPVDVTPEASFDVEFPRWSPDGQYLIFSANESGQWDVWAMWPDGSSRVNLTPSLGNAYVPSIQLVAPKITVQPVTASTSAGNPITLSVGAVGSGPLHFQWQFNGTDIPGATGLTLTIPGQPGALAGTYQVMVSNSAGSTTSQAAILSFLGIQIYAGLTIYGPVGAQYTIQACGDLARGVWTPLATVTLNQSPYFWLDTNSPGNPQRFYRAVLSP